MGSFWKTGIVALGFRVWKVMFAKGYDKEAHNRMQLFLVIQLLYLTLKTEYF